jgi:alpha-galactosidase
MLIIGNTPCSAVSKAAGMQCNGITHDQEQTQMAFWCLWAAPLLISADMRKIPAASAAILKNVAAISINQDRLGRQGFRVRNTPEGAWPGPSVQVWQKPLVDGVAIVAYNFNGTQTPITIEFDDVGFSAVTAVKVHDIFAKADLGSFIGHFTTAAIPTDGSGFYKLTLAD